MAEFLPVLDYIQGSRLLLVPAQLVSLLLEGLELFIPGDNTTKRMWLN
jgi:hypothetical protein